MEYLTSLYIQSYNIAYSVYPTSWQSADITVTQNDHALKLLTFMLPFGLATRTPNYMYMYIPHHHGTTIYYDIALIQSP